MSHDVIMPQMGESVAEGTITTWLKQVGDHVERDEPLFEISTDKVDAEIPSPTAGTLIEIRANPGDTVAVDAIVAVIDEAGGNAQAQPPAPVAPTETAPAEVAAPAVSAPTPTPTGGSAQEVRMPQMGESVAEGTVTTWLKQVGEAVARDEPLFEISTDKVDAEVPSPVEGTLSEIRVQPGETVEIDAVVAIVTGGSGASAAQATSAPAPASAPTPASAPAAAPSAATPVNGIQSSASDRKKVKSSPVVRKIAGEHKIDITRVPATGMGGRVTKKDIVAFIEGGGAAAAAAAPAAGTRAPSSSAPAIFGDSAIPEGYRPRVYEGDRVEPLSTMRSRIAEHMGLSRRISAHVQTVWEFDFTNIDKLRKKYKQIWLDKHGVKLTFTHFIEKATVDALKQFPIVNASLDGNNAIYHQHVNLGVAVALDWGLLVPVVQKSDELNLLGIARQTNDLVDRARNKKLKPDEVQGGTFTITNPGIYGNLFGVPIINQPQTAILSVGGIEKRPVVIDDAIAIRTRCYFCMSFDHRLIDGAVGDQFMAKLREGIENFQESELA